MTIAAAEWRSFVFEGPTLKPSASIPLDDGSVRMSVFDVDDDVLDVRFRINLPKASQRRSQIIGARATAIDSSGREIAMSSQGRGSASSGEKVEHRLGFQGGGVTTTGAVKKLRLELPMSKAPGKEVAFRIPKVPISESRFDRKVGR